jgi:hypothetical protein
MSMTPREAFKFGFMLKCAELGLDDAQMRTLVDTAIEKTADDGGGIGLWGKGKDLLSGLRSLGGWGIAAGVGAGAGTGYLAAKMTEPDVDADEYKQMELIAAMRQYAEHARRSAARLQTRTAPSMPARQQLFPMGAH